MVVKKRRRLKVEEGFKVLGMVGKTLGDHR